MHLPRHRTPVDGNPEDRGGAPRRRLPRPLSGSSGRASPIAGAAIAVGVAPAALAAGPSAKAAAAHGKGVLVGGIHNPAHSAFSRTTGLFGNTNGWVMRLKNQGNGGGQTVECKAATGGACLESSNGSTGFAFDFKSGGATGGTIQLSNPAGAPFTTNARGVATGLNANYLQGQEASMFQLASKPAADSEKLGGKPAGEYQLASKPAGDSEKLGGKPASEFVTTAQVMFATVGGEKLESTRGATGLTRSGSTYTVVFGSNVSKCAYTASPQGTALESGALGVGPTGGNANGVNVMLPAGYNGGFDLQVDC
ncbi:MAG: hypothetical protein ACYCSI_15695 [Solirubrobacteraceae bacterium]